MVLASGSGRGHSRCSTETVEKQTMRKFLLIALIFVAAACSKHDNASPFTHGAQNGQDGDLATKTDSTTSTASSTQATDTVYGGSSGVAGGVRSDTATTAGGTSTVGGAASPAANQPVGPAGTQQPNSPSTPPASPQ